ncbi:MAG: M55 family metallopeptidase [Armatimonadetes bacterium]|nr:M55 family metallopeptidase [Armatimonadota bacterium]
MRILICTDMEGISGVCIWDQTRDQTTAHYQEARRLLMADIAAAVDGCRAGGADDVVASDGHGGGFNFVPELMHPGARYLTGRQRTSMTQREAFFRAVDGVILLGYHAMAETPDGILRHTQSSLGGNRYWYNDRECGEIAQSALVYGHFGIPVVMLTGDTAACREAREFLGEAIVTVPVKEGYSAQFGLLMAPKDAHDRIREGAQQAMGRIRECRPFTMELPIRGRLRVGDKSIADARRTTRSRRVDDCTFETVFEIPLEIYSF